MTPLRPRAARAAHQALNQPKPRATLPPWTGDAPLRALIAARAPCTAEPLAAFAAIIGRPEAQDNARMAERNPPELHQFDRTGRRIDAVALHPGRHAALSRGGGQGGLRRRRLDRAGRAARHGPPRSARPRRPGLSDGPGLTRRLLPADRDLCLRAAAARGRRGLRPLNRRGAVGAP